MDTSPARRPTARKTTAERPAETCLREWIAVQTKPAKGDDALAARTAARKAIEDRASLAIARSNVGAAFQLLLAITSWAWSPDDTDDRNGELSERSNASLTDGTNYRTRCL